MEKFPSALLYQQRKSHMKIVSVMKLSAILLFIFTLQVNASGWSQKITLDFKNAPLEKIFREITRQSGYMFIYNDKILEKTNPVTVTIVDANVETTMSICLSKQPVGYEIQDKTIIITGEDPMMISEDKQIVIVSGIVVDSSDHPLEGVSVVANSSGLMTSSNEKGEFVIKVNNENEILHFSSVGYQKLSVRAREATNARIHLALAVKGLDETIVIAYGKTSARLNTGSVSKVSFEDIQKQPISNPLAALAGRVPGLTVVQGSGVPGSSFKIQIRGQNSIVQGSDPLIIIDGVPYSSNNSNLNSLISMLSSESGTGLSPFSLINPSDIQSIEILKDADATAIYGSRGANGVILVTTKKSPGGKLKADIRASTGVSSITRSVEMLTTNQYLSMRKEAFANDGLVPSSVAGDQSFAPDLLLWDTARYTDFRKLLTGGKAWTTDGQFSLSGGNSQTGFLFSGNHRYESTIFPGNLSNNTSGANLSVTHVSADKRFNFSATSIYVINKNQLAAGSSIYYSTNLSPNAPSLYQPDGNLNWSENGVRFINPLAFLARKYTAQNENFLGNLLVSYKLLSNLVFRTSVGYNSIHTDEKSLTPIMAQNPADNPTGSSQFSNAHLSNWIAEPQAEYNGTFGKGRITILTGMTFQQNETERSAVGAAGYVNDDLLASLEAAPYLDFRNNSYAQYRYTALFGRINYNLLNRYIFSFSGRRDGSSRFGPGRRFAIFGAAGVAWVLSNEKFIAKDVNRALSFAKLRASYGSTGNDQIGDYNYLPAWRTTDQYQSSTALIPNNLYNDNYSWEINRKAEVAIELGFFDDRLMISTAYYRNRSSNQLVEYRLPTQTGFFSIVRNLEALVQNSGLELSLYSQTIKSKTAAWSSTIYLTVPRNKLIDFPGLDASSYSSEYVLGQPLSVINRLQYSGVDPQTGVFQFEDRNKDGTIDIPGDYIASGFTGPKYYGGFLNSFSYKNLSLDIFFEYVRQTGRNYLYSIYSSYNIPGSLFNQPAYVLSRWQAPGQSPSIQQFSATTSSNAYAAVENFNYSNGIYGDASYLRLKNIYLAFLLPENVTRKWRIGGLKFFVQIQNAITFTKYKGADPETQNLYSLPPLKTVAAGFQLTL